MRKVNRHRYRYRYRWIDIYLSRSSSHDEVSKFWLHRHFVYVTAWFKCLHLRKDIWIKCRIGWYLSKAACIYIYILIAKGSYMFMCIDSIDRAKDVSRI